MSRDLAWLLPALALSGWLGGLLQWSPDLGLSTFRLAAAAIIVPALGEELIFRCVLMPRPNPDVAMPARSSVIALLLFVLWHPAQALIFGPRWAAVVLNPWLLIAVAALGLACQRAYWRTGSLWPAVALHWLVVVSWKAMFAGPSPWSA